MLPWLKDARFNSTKYLPAAAAGNYSDVMDLGPAPDVRAFALEIAVPALAANTDTTKTVTLTVQESDTETSGFANVAPLIQGQVPGVATSGSAAITFKAHLPPGTKRYIRVAQAVESGGGNNTGDEVAYGLLFYK